MATMLRFPLACALALMAVPAHAQINEFPRDLYENRLDRSGQTVSFCVHGNSILSDFHTELADEIAQAQLIGAEIEIVDSMFPPDPLGYRLPFTAEELFLMMQGRCAAFMGFTVTPDYPDWVMLTRPYMSSPIVLIVDDADITRLEDIPLHRPLGSRIFTGEDNQLRLLIAARAEDQRWQRYPYRNYGIAFERAVDGTVGGSLVWEAGVYHGSAGDPASLGLSVIDALPFQTYPVDLGIGIRSNDRYLELLLSEAIQSLTDDGTIERLLVENNLAPARTR